jgi:polyhydroxyalkanoate synthesis regulator phasin
MEEKKMEPKQIAKQMVDFNKKAFDNSFEAMAVLQDQTEKLVAAMMQQTTFFPEEGKKLINDWLKTYKKGREEFKTAADENFKKVDAFFSSK